MSSQGFVMALDKPQGRPLSRLCSRAWPHCPFSVMTTPESFSHRTTTELGPQREFLSRSPATKRGLGTWAQGKESPWVAISLGSFGKAGHLSEGLFYCCLFSIPRPNLSVSQGLRWANYTLYLYTLYRCTNYTLSSCTWR